MSDLLTHVSDNYPACLLYIDFFCSDSPEFMKRNRVLNTVTQSLRHTTCNRPHVIILCIVQYSCFFIESGIPSQDTAFILSGEWQVRIVQR